MSEMTDRLAFLREHLRGLGETDWADRAEEAREELKVLEAEKERLKDEGQLERNRAEFCRQEAEGMERGFHPKLALMELERDQAREELALYKSRTYCAYCGFTVESEPTEPYTIEDAISFLRGCLYRHKTGGEVQRLTRSKYARVIALLEKIRDKSREES